MLYLTEKSSAPATVRRSTSARIAARSRRIARRAAARVQRAARTPPPLPLPVSTPAPF